MRSVKRVYLDFAAATPTTPAARRAFLIALSTYGNPSSAHEEGRRAKGVLEAARKEIARMAGAKPEHVVFTAGATEANNLAIAGHIAARGGKGHILYAKGAHASLVEPLRALSGVEVEEIPLEGDLVTEVVKRVKDTTILVCLEAVSGETGARFDTRAVRHALDKVRSGITLHVDASQLPLVESFERTRLGADLLTLDAQKVGGVRGVGCLITSAGVALMPLIFGGGQERGLRSGTPSPALLSAFSAALRDAERGREAFSLRAEGLRKELLHAITAAIPDVLVNEGKVQVPHIVNISLPGRDTDYLATLLDTHGFAVSTKSACEADSVEGSRAVMAQFGDADRAKATLRISFGKATKKAEVVAFSKALAEAVRFLDRNKLERYN
jgi:cysteine desulfurase